MKNSKTSIILSFILIAAIAVVSINFTALPLTAQECAAGGCSCGGCSDCYTYGFRQSYRILNMHFSTIYYGCRCSDNGNQCDGSAE